MRRRWSVSTIGESQRLPTRETDPLGMIVNLQSELGDDPKVMRSSLPKISNTITLRIVRRSYLERLENLRMIFTIDVADTFSGYNDPEPDNIVNTQSKPIGQERISAAQEPSRDSNRRVATNDTRRMVRSKIFQIFIDVPASETRSDVKSLLYLVIFYVVKLLHINQDPIVGWIDLWNGEMATAFELCFG